MMMARKVDQHVGVPGLAPDPVLDRPSRCGGTTERRGPHEQAFRKGMCAFY